MGISSRHTGHGNCPWTSNPLPMTKSRIHPSQNVWRHGSAFGCVKLLKHIVQVRWSSLILLLRLNIDGVFIAILNKMSSVLSQNLFSASLAGNKTEDFSCALFLQSSHWGRESWLLYINCVLAISYLAVL